MDDTFWSEYKITFCEPTKCILNYIISKGYVLDQFRNKHFQYNQFNNHFSSDMDKKLIGLKDLSVHRHGNMTTESSTIIYVSETYFNRINNELSDISQTDIDNVLSSNKKTFIIKRGIIVYKDENRFTINLYGIEHILNGYTFIKHNGYMFCKLELVKIKNNEHEGFRPVEFYDLPTGPGPCGPCI